MGEVPGVLSAKWSAGKNPELKIMKILQIL
jgi:hypothetical protein